MTDVVTATRIANRALQHVGAARIADGALATEDSKNASEVRACYDMLRRAELRRNVWRFAVRRATLRALTATSQKVVPAAYVATIAYPANAIVSYNGSVYSSLVNANLGNNPDPGVNTSAAGYWQLYFGVLYADAWNSTGTSASTASTPATAVTLDTNVDFAASLAIAKAYYAVATTVPHGRAIEISYKTVFGDGYGGMFAYNSTDSTTTFSSDGLGFVDNQGRRFFRQFDGDANAKWFGAKGDGTGVVPASDTDYTAELQAAINAAFAANLNLKVPAGVYKTTGITLPGTGDNQNRAFRLYGQGAGVVFARSFTGQTTIYSVTNAAVLSNPVQETNRGTPNFEVDNIRFEGNSTTPVVSFNSFYSQSHFHHCGIYQAGTGNGLQCVLSNTINIHDNYAINRDWNTGGLGAARVGTGFKIYQTIGTGLTTLHKNTSRGFKDGYVFGDGVVAMYSPSISECESSNNHNGVTIQTACDKATVRNNYFEGGDGGRGVYILGNYCTTNDNLIFPGFAKAIDDTSLTNYGSYGTGNILSAGSVPSTTLLDIGDGGLGKTYIGNTLIFAGSGGTITNVIGIHLTGADARINYSGNILNPAGAWTGGAGTKDIVDATTAGSGAAGTSHFSFGMVKIGVQQFPYIGHGVYGLGLSPTTLGNGAVAANVLTLPESSDVLITFAGAQVINAVTANNIDGKFGCMTFLAGTAQATFTNSATLRCPGGVNFVVAGAANGGVVFYKAQYVGGALVTYIIAAFNY